MQRANAAVPGAAPHTAGPGRSSGALAMEFLPPADHPLWKTQLRDGHADPGFRRAGRDMRWCASMPRPRPIPPPPPISHRPHLLRHPPGALSARHRARASRPRAAPAKRSVATTQDNKRALVHGDVSPKNILRRPARPGVPGRGVRLVGRSRVRSGVLPQPPVAEMLVDAGRHRRLPRAASMRSARAYCRRCRLGTAGRTGSPRRTAAAGVVPRPGGWQVAGRVHHRRAADKDRVRRTARALLRDPPDRLADVRQAWSRELAA